MSYAIKKLRDYLAKSPSVIYPEDVLAYLPAIEAENAKLRAERDEWQRVAASKQDIIDHMRDTSSSNMRLRELCADMLMCLTWTNEPHGYMEDGCDCCRFKGKTHGACGLGMFRGRSSELGVEVD